MGTTYVCAISGKPINKNHEAYHGPITQAMVARIRKDCPGFHPKDDIHKEVGDKYWAEVQAAARPAWVDRRLG